MQAQTPREDQPTRFYCINHPNVETFLHCNRCGNPICLACVEHMDVGYRCKQCVREQQSTYFNSKPQDRLFAFVVALAITVSLEPLAAMLLRTLASWDIPVAFITGANAGKMFADVIRRAIEYRRSHYLHWWVTSAIVIGVLISSLMLHYVGATFLLSQSSLWLFFVLVTITTNRELR